MLIPRPLSHVRNKGPKPVPQDGPTPPDTMNVADVAHALTRAGAAIAANDLREAGRWADRARRLAPESVKVAELQGRLALRARDFAGALAFLEFAAKEGASADLEAAVARTLLRLERPEEAVRRIQEALRRFALEPGGALAAGARDCALAAGAPGWIGLTADLAIFGEARSLDMAARAQVFCGVIPLQTTAAPGPWPDAQGGALRARAPFGVVGEVSAHLDGAALLGGGLALPPDLRLEGRVLLRDGRLEGWVRMGWRPGPMPALWTKIGAGARQTLAAHEDPARAGAHAFAADLGALTPEAQVTVEVEAPYGGLFEVPGSPAWAAPPPAPPAAPPRSPGPAPTAPPAQRAIDVIVPVYAGLKETLACIRSVRETIGDGAQIMLVDDACPDTALKEALAGVAHEGAARLLVNEDNLGFAGAVNRALDLNPDRDVVILNADAEVFPGWLQRLRQAAYGADDIGTATPLTNAGAIASYPAGLGAPCAADAAAALDALAARVNAGVAVDAPTGVGFCLYIRADCRAAVGLFDASCFGRGYGEETDFCLRAAAAGWRHVIAADVFVRHVEGVSFGALRQALVTRNEQLLAARHPGYRTALDAFGAADPLRPARRRLDEARLLEGRGRVVLMLAHDRGGGVTRAVEARREELRAAGLRTLVMRPDQGRVRLLADGPELSDLVYAPDTEADALFALLAALQIASLELHHTAGHHPEIIRRLQTAAPQHVAHIHDYSWLCPRITLIDGSGRYCGEPDLAVCQRCVEVNGSETGDHDVAALRSRSEALLSAAERVVAPSADAARRIAARFPGVAPQVRPLERRGFLPSRRRRIAAARVKVLVLGAIGVSKGFEVLLAAARDAVARALPLEFVVIGFTRDDAALLEIGNVFVTGEYAEAEVETMILRESPDIAFFPSVWPETWLYALTPALRARLPVVAFDLGAQAERIRAAGAAHRLLPLGAPPEAVNQTLIDLVRHTPPERPRGFSLPPPLASSREAASLEPVHPPRPAPAPTAGADRLAPAPQMAAPAFENLAAGAGAPAKSPDNRPMPKAPLGLTANAQILTLAKGIFRFSVHTGGAERYRPDSGISLPALQIAVGPGAVGGTVEFMTGLRSDGAWLFGAGDVLIAKVKAADTPLLVTSYSVEGLAPLAIAVERIDEPPSEVRASALPGPRGRQALLGEGAASQRSGPAERLSRTPVPQRLTSGGRFPVSEDGRRILKARVTAHISRRGDVEFQDEEWIGDNGLRHAIEGFAVHPPEGFSSQDVEYKAVSEKGIETPWISGGELCGTRRLGLALAGFAIRLRGDAARRAECRYSGVFQSGAVVGPAVNGAPVRSTSLDDVLTGIQLRFLVPDAPGRDPGGAPGRGPVLRAPERQDAPRPAGPRFSVFREETGPTRQ